MVAISKKNQLSGLNSLTKNLQKKPSGEPKAAQQFAGISKPDINVTDIPAHMIALENIQPREINDFSAVSVTILKQHIYREGLIHPIAVVEKPNNPKYVIISGHRRFQAFTELNKEYPDDTRFTYISATIYKLTDDPELYNDPTKPEYISAETEEQMYKDANLDARQMKYQDALLDIENLINSISSEDYYVTEEQAIQQMVQLESAAGIKRDHKITKLNINEYVADVLSLVYHYEGWSRETVRRYMGVREAATVLKNEEAIELMRRIHLPLEHPENIAIKTAYEKLFPKKPKVAVKKTATKKIKTSVQSIQTELKKKRQLTSTEINDLEIAKQIIEDILKSQEK